MTINCKGTLIDITSPKVMGILNLTPDSFFDGGRYETVTAALSQTERLLSEGATFIDVGAYSSRPGAKHLNEQEELERLLPVVEAIARDFPKALLSIDTFRSTVAAKAIEAGAAMINDISAGYQDPHMMEVVGQLGVPYIMMHMKGTPQTMQSLTQYEDIIKEVLLYFSERISKARAAKINDIMIDPGFGFSKTIERNYELLQKMESLNICELPVLVGLSRKSMIYKTLDITPTQALNGTTALHMVALEKGAKILRVHDVKEAVECVRLYEALN